MHRSSDGAYLVQCECVIGTVVFDEFHGAGILVSLGRRVDPAKLNLATGHSVKLCWRDRMGKSVCGSLAVRLSTLRAYAPIYAGQGSVMGWLIVRH